jgi:hypothetical protein
LIDEQLPIAYNVLRKDPSYLSKEGKSTFTAEDVQSLAREYALKNLTEKDNNGQFKYYKDDHPALREMLTDRLRTYSPPKEDKYFEGLENRLERWGKTGKDVKTGGSTGGLSEGIKDVVQEMQQQPGGLRFQAARPGEPTITATGQVIPPTTTITPQGPVTTTTGGSWTITADDLDKHKKGSKSSAPTQPTTPPVVPTQPPPLIPPPPPPPPPTPTRQGPVPTSGLGSMGSISFPPPPPAAPDPRVRTAYIGSGGSNLPTSVSGSYLPPGPGEALEDALRAAGVAGQAVGSGARWAGQKAAAGAGATFDSLRGVPAAGAGSDIAQVANPTDPRMQPGENYAQYQARLAMLNRLRGQ